MNDWLEKRREARRPVEEAGGGEAEGFEQAEQELIERAENWEGRSPMKDAFPSEEAGGGTYGEADHERTSEDDQSSDPDLHGRHTHHQRNCDHQSDRSRDQSKADVIGE